MSDETGTPAGASDSDQVISEVGAKVWDLFSKTGLLPKAGDAPAATPIEIGQMLHAFVHIRDPRVRGELVSLIEALRGISLR